MGLANRFAGTVAMGMVSISLVGWLALRFTLDRAIDSSLMSVASIQAAAVTDSPDGVMAFHEWDLTPEEASSVRELNRFAQIWDRTGRSLLRTRYITTDLPLDSSALERAGEGEIVWVRQTFEGMPIRTLYYPLERRGVLHEGHVLQVSAPMEARDATLLATALFLLGIAGLVTVGTWAGAWWLGGSAVRPVYTIIEQAREIEGGTLDRRISAYAETSEYRGLVEVLNTMLGRLQAAFASQRRFTQDAGHELRGPLTAMRGELEVAMRRPRSPEEYREVLESSVEEVDRLARISDELLTLARSDGGVMEPRAVDLPLEHAVGVAVDRVRSEFAKKGVALDTDQGASVTAAYDPDLVVRVIWNLLDNALEHTPPGGTVLLRTHRDGDHAVLEVADSGPGIPVDYRQKVFERFFRADESRGPRSGGRQGTGLGLSIVKAVAEAHGGDVSVKDSPLGGALFRVRLPLAPPPA
jgi:two-component system OmpR family sensor kinase